LSCGIVPIVSESQGEMRDLMMESPGSYFKSRLVVCASTRSLPIDVLCSTPPQFHHAEIFSCMPASVWLPTCCHTALSSQMKMWTPKRHRFVYSIKALVNLQWLSSNPTHSETQQCVFSSISLSSSCSARLSWPRPYAFLTLFYAQH